MTEEDVATIVPPTLSDTNRGISTSLVYLVPGIREGQVPEKGPSDSNASFGTGVLSG